MILRNLYKPAPPDALSAAITDSGEFGGPVFDQAFDIVPTGVSAMVKTDFFRSGYKAPKLREAYAAARSAWFYKPHSRSA